MSKRIQALLAVLVIATSIAASLNAPFGEPGYGILRL